MNGGENECVVFETISCGKVNGIMRVNTTLIYRMCLLCALKFVIFKQWWVCVNLNLRKKPSETRRGRRWNCLYLDIDELWPLPYPYESNFLLTLGGPLYVHYIQEGSVSFSACLHRIPRRFHFKNKTNTFTTSHYKNVKKLLTTFNKSFFLSLFNFLSLAPVEERFGISRKNIRTGWEEKDQQGMRRWDSFAERDLCPFGRWTIAHVAR